MIKTSFKISLFGLICFFLSLNNCIAQETFEPLQLEKTEPQKELTSQPEATTHPIEQQEQVIQINEQPKLDDFGVEPENTSVMLSLNDKLYYDSDVYVNVDSSFSIPFKSIAKILDAEVDQNHLTKEISFKTNDGTQGLVDFKNQRIIYGNRTYQFEEDSKIKLVYLENGVFDWTKDEVFVPIKLLNDLFEDDITADYSDYSIKINTNRSLKAILKYNQSKEGSSGDPFAPVSGPDETFIKVFKPEKTISPFTLETIKMNSRSNYNANSRETQTQSFKNSFLNSFSQLTFEGELLGGQYEILSTSNYNQNDFFRFGGLRFKYKKDFEALQLELGQVQGLKAGEINIANNLFGATFGNMKQRAKNYRSLFGEVEPGSKVHVYLNDKFFNTLDTKGGFYELKDLPGFSERVTSLSLEEENLEGNIKPILKKNYPISADLVAKGETKYSFITGLTGTRQQFFSEMANSYENRTKKAVIGGTVSKGITNKLSINLTAVKDQIIYLPKQANVFTNKYFDSRTLRLMTGSSKSFEKTQGLTGLIGFDYEYSDNLTVSGLMGFSSADSQVDDRYYKLNPTGVSTSLGFEYQKDSFGLKAKVFKHSPDFYLAGNDFGGYNSNRIGGEIGTSFSLGRLKVSGNYQKYYTNLDNFMPGGKYAFNTYNLSLGLPLKKFGDVKFNYRNRGGSNSIGKIVNSSYDLSYTKKFSKKLSFKASQRKNTFETLYNDMEDGRSYSSSYSNISAELDYKISPQVGAVRFMHNITKSEGNGRKNGYNSVSLGYTFPTFKGVSLSTNVGKHYAGINKGLDFSTNLAYQFKSGRQVGLSYSYNKVLGSFYDNIFLPTNSRHYVSMNVTDALSLIGGGIKFVGNQFKQDSGIVDVLAYLDVNKNGIRDEKEPLIPDIPLYAPGHNGTAYTDRGGQFTSKGVSEGLYKVAINYDELPTMLSISPNSFQTCMIKVDKKKKTSVEFGFISSVGTVSGRINVVDEFNREVNIKNLVVLLLDEKGEEVTYTSLEHDGHYEFSGLNPGKYIVQVDKAFIDTYKLKPILDEKKMIEVPPVFDDYVDITDIDLQYLQTVPDINIS